MQESWAFNHFLLALFYVAFRCCIYFLSVQFSPRKRGNRWFRLYKWLSTKECAKYSCRCHKNIHNNHNNSNIQVFYVGSSDCSTFHSCHSIRYPLSSYSLSIVRRTTKVSKPCIYIGKSLTHIHTRGSHHIISVHLVFFVCVTFLFGIIK